MTQEPHKTPPISRSQWVFPRVFALLIVAGTATLAAVPAERLIARLDAALVQHQCMTAIENHAWPNGPPSSVTPWIRYDAHGLQAVRMIVEFKRPDGSGSAISIDCLAGRTAQDVQSD
jgi:hypothetical protein